MFYAEFPPGNLFTHKHQHFSPHPGRMEVGFRSAYKGREGEGVREKEKSQPERGGGSQKVRAGQALADLFAHSHSPEWGPRSYQHRALRLRVSLGWILVLQGGLNDQLLLVISPTGPVLISLHSPPRTVVRKPAAGTAESPLLLEARAHTPLARGRKGSRFPRHEGSALLLGWMCGA